MESGTWNQENGTYLVLRDEVLADTIVIADT